MASVDEGTPHEVAEAAVAPLGLPISPFVLLQLVGPAVALHVAETLHAAFPDRFDVSANLGRIVEAGKPGVYSWDDKGRPFIDDETRALIEQGDAPQTADELREPGPRRAGRGDPADARRGRRRRTSATSTSA